MSEYYRDKKRKNVVADAETVAPEWREIDEPTRLYLMDRARNRARYQGDDDLSDGEAEEIAADHMSLDMGLIRIAAIGFHFVEEDRAVVFVEKRTDIEIPPVRIPGVKVRELSEKEMLQQWWQFIGERRLIGFNTRCYDAPALMIRSAQLGVRCTRNLVGNRYSFSEHLDMAEALTFQGALRGGYTVDYWCRCFGIRSPKEVANGSMVRQMYREGRMQEIADYVHADATGEKNLYLHLLPMLCVFTGGPTYYEPEDPAQIVLPGMGTEIDVPAIAEPPQDGPTCEAPGQNLIVPVTNKIHLL